MDRSVMVRRWVVAAFFAIALVTFVVELVFVGEALPIALHAVILAIALVLVAMTWRPISKR
jgi:hypothetical protein